MTAPTVTLPRIVGHPSVAAAALVPWRWEPRIAVSFKGVVEVTMPALREIVQTGTGVGTRPLHLLDTNPSIVNAVGIFLEDEPIFAPFVLFEPLPAPDPFLVDRDVPPPPEPDDREPTFTLAFTDHEWRVIAAALEADKRETLTLVLADRIRDTMVDR